MAATPEGKVKKAVKEYLRSIGAWYFSPVSNGMGVHGIPDIIACWRGRFVAIETKAPGRLGRVSELQKIQLASIRAAGGIAVVADDVQTVMDVFSKLADDQQ